MPGSTVTTSLLREKIEGFFSAVSRKDMDGLLAFFAEDGVFLDPHYPNPRMVGRAQIREGLEWAFGLLSAFGFPVVNYFESEDGTRAAVEVATAHRMANGNPLEFPQVFIVETRGGLATRVQSFLPYGPPSLG